MRGPRLSFLYGFGCFVLGAAMENVPHTFVTAMVSALVVGIGAVVVDWRHK